MYEFRTADLLFCVLHPSAGGEVVLRRPALLCAARPLSLLAADSIQHPLDPVFASALPSHVPAQLRVEEGHALVVVCARSDPLQAALQAVQAAGELLYLPPLLQLGCHWLQREACKQGSVPQAHLVALASVMGGWLRACPRIVDARIARRGRAPSARDARLASELRAQLVAGMHRHDRLDQIAARLGVGRASLNRALRGCVGLSVAGLRRELRLRVAAVDLLDGNASCAAVSQAYGYASPAQFSRDFQQLYGAPPSRVVSLLDALLGVAAPR